MKHPILLKKFLQLPEWLLIIWLFMVNQAIFAQENGYWDDRFSADPSKWNYENINFIHAIAVTNSGDMYASGVNLIGGLIKWNSKNWSRFANVPVYSFLQIDNDLYLGGGFSKVDSLIPANNIAKYNLVNKTWSPLEGGGSNGVDHKVFAMAAEGNDLYVGGAFKTAGGIPANHIAKYNIVTKTWTPLRDGVDGSVQAIAVKNGEVYVGSSVGGVSANNIAKWNGHEWSALGSGVNSKVYALTFCGDDLYVGGIFTQAGGNKANYIAKWNISTQTWSNMGGGIDEGFGNGVFVLASNGRVVYVGGRFSYVSGMQVGTIAKWNPVKGCWSRVGGNRRGDGGSVDGQVNTILARGKDIYLGGEFRNAGGKPSHLFAIWHESASPSPHAPAWSSVPDVTFFEDDSTSLELYQYVTDTEHDLRGGLNFSAMIINPPTVVKSNDLQIRLQKVVMGPSGRYLYATFASAKDANGIYTVVFTVTDACGASASDTIQVTVTPVNNAPVIATLPTLTFNEDDSLLYSIRNWFDYVTDADEADSILSFKVLSAKSIKAIRRGSSYLFTAPVNWNGTNTLKLIVTDHGQLADTAALVIKVNPINDAPKITGLPDSLSFKKGASAQLKIWDFVEDVETPDSLLAYGFSVSTTSIKLNFNPTTGMLVLTAPQFSGNAKLFVNISDGKASARDTIGVRVELPTSVASSNEQIPTEFVLMQNYPNPFNPTTLIRFGLPHEAEVKIEVLNLSGQHIATLLNERRSAGYHNVEFNAQNLASGVYFYRLTAEQFTAMRKLLLVQ